MITYNLRDIVRRVGKYRRGVFAPPPIRPTQAQERELLRIYMQVVRGWQAQVRDRIMPAYGRALADLVRDDVSDVTIETTLAEAQMAALVAALNRQFVGWVDQVEAWHRRRFAQSFTPTGVNLTTLLGRGDVAQTLQAVLQENVELIRGLNSDAQRHVAGAVYRGLTERLPARDVAREIRKGLGIDARRAELIAADQLQKLTSRLDEERQKQAGLGSFIWHHSRKLNPREEHKVRDGKKYGWNSAVAKTDPPGRAIRCGCKAGPVLDLDDDEDE